MEFGKTMRAAREAKNYTVSQLAEITRLTPQVVDGLEMENFSNIAAPIYGRGFVKLYAEAVGLDVKAMQQAFMSAYNGETTPEEPMKAEEKPEPAAEPAPPPVCDDLFEGNRYAAPARSYGSSFCAPKIPWRLIVVLAAALAILVFAVFSIRFVWRQLSAPVEAGRETRVASAAAQVVTPAKTVSPDKKRTPRDVKALDID